MLTSALLRLFIEITCFQAPECSWREEREGENNIKWLSTLIEKRNLKEGVFTIFESLRKTHTHSHFYRIYRWNFNIEFKQMCLNPFVFVGGPTRSMPMTFLHSFESAGLLCLLKHSTQNGRIRIADGWFQTSIYANDEVVSPTDSI